MKTNKARDRRLRKTYGVDLEWYNARLAAQGNSCGICRRPSALFTRSLAVDHDHGWKKIRISTSKIGPKDWYACVLAWNYASEGSGTTKSQAIKSVKDDLRRQSVRGILCNFCNRGLRFYADDPVRLENAAQYLRKFKEKQ